MLTPRSGVQYNYGAVAHNTAGIAYDFYVFCIKNLGFLFVFICFYLILSLVFFFCFYFVCYLFWLYFDITYIFQSDLLCLLLALCKYLLLNWIHSYISPFYPFPPSLPSLSPFLSPSHSPSHTHYQVLMCILPNHSDTAGRQISQSNHESRLGSEA